MHTSREQTFHPRPKWALVPTFFAPGTRDTFSPGWCLQSGLKEYLYSWLDPPTGSKGPPTGSKGLLSGHASDRGWKETLPTRTKEPPI
jgi:hypothetical protein